MIGFLAQNIAKQWLQLNQAGAIAGLPWLAGTAFGQAGRGRSAGGRRFDIRVMSPKRRSATAAGGDPWAERIAAVTWSAALILCVLTGSPGSFFVLGWPTSHVFVGCTSGLKRIGASRRPSANDNTVLAYPASRNSPFTAG
jgi:hypothetical protein